MGMIYITRKEHFSASHKLFKEEWSDSQNAEVFGKCSNPNGHGHNYQVYVTIKGDPDKETGFLVNLKTVSSIINEFVIDRVDHKNLNEDVDFLQGIMPTTENVAIGIWEQLQPEIEKLNCSLHCVKLQETDNNYAEYFG